MEWTAGWRAPAYGNYAFRIGPGPSRLVIDDVEVLSVGEGLTDGVAVISLPAGDHALRYAGVLTEAGAPALLQEAQVADGTRQALGRAEWAEIPTNNLIAAQDSPMGLLATAQFENAPGQQWIDKALATCCLSQQIATEGRIPYTVVWSGELHPPVPGAYRLELWAQGALDLKIDGVTVLTAELDGDKTATADVDLAESHSIDIVYRVREGAGGIQWTWTRPDGVTSIVPPSALTPPNATVGRPVPESILAGIPPVSRDYPFETLK
jgi:hypothetical protein